MNHLLFDFGASRIKSVIFQTDKKEFLNLYSTDGAALENINEVPIDFFFDSFKKHINYQENQKMKIDAINICSEMHGYVLADDLNKLNQELYFSWRSEKRIKKQEDLEYFFSNLDFKKSTGMTPKNGLPVFNIRSHKNFKKKSFFLTLPECLISAYGQWNGKISKTIAAASGLYDIESSDWIHAIKKNKNIQLPIVSSKIDETYGSIKLKDCSVPVYGCIGDLQACFYSLGLKEDEININLGTGSQVSSLKSGKNFEIRPLFDKKNFFSITHIPCGRALNIFSELFFRIYGSDKKNKNIFWDLFFLKSDLENKGKIPIDFNIFKGPYKSINQEKILEIININFDPKILIDNIKFSLIAQYSEIINFHKESNKKLRKIIITGSLGEKIIDFQDILNKDTNIEVTYIHNDIDSSLVGLSEISMAIEKNKINV